VGSGSGWNSTGWAAAAAAPLVQGQQHGKHLHVYHCKCHCNLAAANLDAIMNHGAT